MEDLLSHLSGANLEQIAKRIADMINGYYFGGASERLTDLENGLDEK